MTRRRRVVPRSGPAPPAALVVSAALAVAARAPTPPAAGRADREDEYLVVVVAVALVFEAFHGDVSDPRTFRPNPRSAHTVPRSWRLTLDDQEPIQGTVCRPSQSAGPPTTTADEPELCGLKPAGRSNDVLDAGDVDFPAAGGPPHELGGGSVDHGGTLCLPVSTGGVG